MLFTVSTVRDSLPNVQRFVSGNVAGGVDHMFVVLDEPDAEVERYLADHPHVTCIGGDDAWWAGRRPPSLNARQRLNANVVKALLSVFPWGEWVFHVDSDEVVQVDRSALASAPDGTVSVSLAPREAVSRRSWNGDPTWFKRLLPHEDLVLLTTLGVIDEPSNGALFRGHTRGKSGVRPRLDLWLGIHSALGAEQERLPSFSHDALALLHYESVSGDEFVRKWKAFAATDQRVQRRASREGTVLAVTALLEKGLPEEDVERYLMRIYERTAEDAFTVLRDLGLLVEVDARRGTHQPVPFPPGAREDATALLRRLSVEPKNVFGPRSAPEAAQQVLDRAIRSA